MLNSFHYKYKHTDFHPAMFIVTADLVGGGLGSSCTFNSSVFILFILVTGPATFLITAVALSLSESKSSQQQSYYIDQVS